jgi:class 3 adenylate cyclase
MVETADQSFATCTVFAEIVDYAKKPVAEQIKLTERFNALLEEALKKIVPEDRIILETGAGAAVSCLGKTEDALLVAVDLRDRVAALPAADGPALSAHFGINLGPAKLVTEEGSEPNIVGDGLNVAQTVMSFAEPGQILVSRSYHDAVSAVSSTFARMLRPEGSRTDKYLREHHVYAVSETANVAAAAAALSPEERRKRLRMGALAAIAAILVLAIGIRVSRGKPAPPPEPAPGPVAEQAPATTPPPTTPAPPAAAPASGPAPAVSPPATDTAPTPDAKAAAKKKAVKPKTEVAAAPAPAPAAAAAPAAPPPGSLEFAITPWGEVYVDGAKRGVSPPMTQIPIAPGKHSIEIRNTSFPSYTTTVEVSSGAQSKIKYKFN